MLAIKLSAGVTSWVGFAEVQNWLPTRSHWSFHCCKKAGIRNPAGYYAVLPIGTSELRYLVQIIMIWNLLTFNHLTAEADEHSTRLHISTWIQRSQHLYEHVVGGENYPVADWTWVQKLTTWLTVPFLCCFSPSFKFRIEQLWKPFRPSWSTAFKERGKVNRPCVSTPDLAFWWVISNGLKTDSNLAAAVEGKFIARRGQAGWVSCSCFSWKDFRCYSGNCIYIFSAYNII